MTSRDFAYWLQGYFELGDAPSDTLNASQVATIRKHLALVFVHEIDPGAGPPAHQAILDAIHRPSPPLEVPISADVRWKAVTDTTVKPLSVDGGIGGIGPNGQVYRC